MANTAVQHKVEAWLRDQWLPKHLIRQFRAMSVTLSTGAVFAFDAVSDDSLIAVSISTSARRTKSGKPGSGKLHKIHSDALFLVMATKIERRILLFTEKDMFDFVQGEKKRGRLPAEIEVMIADIPPDLRIDLEKSREESIREVSMQPL